MMNPVPWLQMTNMISYQGLVRTFPSLYDGVFNGIAEYIDMYETLSAKEINDRIEVLKNDDEFKKASGVASNYKERVKKRITRALEIFA